MVTKISKHQHTITLCRQAYQILANCSRMNYLLKLEQLAGINKLAQQIIIQSQTIKSNLSPKPKLLQRNRWKKQIQTYELTLVTLCKQGFYSIVLAYQHYILNEHGVLPCTLLAKAALIHSFYQLGHISLAKKLAKNLELGKFKIKEIILLQVQFPFAKQARDGLYQSYLWLLPVIPERVNKLLNHLLIGKRWSRFLSLQLCTLLLGKQNNSTSSKQAISKLLNRARISWCKLPPSPNKTNLGLLLLQTYTQLNLSEITKENIVHTLGLQSKQNKIAKGTSESISDRLLSYTLDYLQEHAWKKLGWKVYLKKQELTEQNLVTELLQANPLANKKSIFTEQEMTNLPLVTILVPTYNAASYIQATLQSLLQQSYPNLEIIVIDDASRDNTLTLVQELQTKFSNLRCYSLTHNVGPFAAKNLGLLVAKGEFIATHDADDWAHPEKISLQVQPLLRDAKLKATTSRWLRLGIQGKISVRLGFPILRLNPSSLLLRREVFTQLGHWEWSRTGADSEFIARVKAYYGESAVLNQSYLLTIGGYSSNSLMFSQNTGYTSLIGTFKRQNYWRSWKTQHLNLEKLEQFAALLDRNQLGVNWKPISVTSDQILSPFPYKQLTELFSQQLNAIAPYLQPEERIDLTSLLANLQAIKQQSSTNN